MNRLDTSQLNKIEKMLKNKKLSIKKIALSVGVSVQAIHNHANKNGWDSTREEKPPHWSEKKISLRLRELHALCIERNIEFTNSQMRELDSKLASYMDRKKISWSDALKKCGIDFRCHIKQFSYGKNDEERFETFRNLIIKIMEHDGIQALNDNSMNSKELVGIPFHRNTRSKKSRLCEESGCTQFKLTKKSIYAQGRRYFGTWEIALKNVGIDYEEVLRKPQSLEFESVIKKLDEFDRARPTGWSISNIRREESALERAIYNRKTRKNESYPYKSLIEDTVFAVWVNLQYWRETGEIREDIQWFQVNKGRLGSEFNAKHRSQESWNDNEIILGIQGLFARGEEKIRLSRNDVINRGLPEDKTLWSAMRQNRFRENEINENDWLKRSGILIDNLRRKYDEINEKYNAKECLDIFSSLMSKSLGEGTNCLTREFNSQENTEFHNFIISKYGSWEAGLRDFGLDPKFFSITASKRTRRGFRFQTFMDETFEKYGLIKTNENPGAGEYVSNRFIPDCKHSTRCRPDFLFNKMIIDTKTGYHGSQKPEQLVRYHDHISNVVILTLKDKKREETIEGRKILVIGFDEFVKDSKNIVGIEIPNSVKTELGIVLKQHPFWG